MFNVENVKNLKHITFNGKPKFVFNLKIEVFYNYGK